MTGLLNDLRFALRALFRYPAFTSVAVTTLALGIGATTAVFTLVDGVLIRPLALREPDRLVALEHLGRDGQDELPMSTGLYLVYHERARSLEGLALYVPSVVNLLAGAEPERVNAQTVTPGYFEVLGVAPALGRSFLAEEELPGAEPVAILSDGLWRTNYAADPSIVGRTLDMNGTSRTVVGVMPPDFGHPNRDARIWIPMTIDPAQAPLAAFGASGVGRMAAGSTAETVLVELQDLVGRLGELFPEDGASAFLAEVGLKARVRPLKEAVVGDVRPTLWVLLGTVGFVLLIACANVANLLLVRAEGRQRELALRVSVGAGRIQVLRSFMAESVVLAATGGALGVGLAWLVVRASPSFVPADLPRMAEVGLDARVLGVTATLTMGCALFFGLFPLMRYGTRDLASQLRDGGSKGGTSGPARHRLRSGLVVVQVALALVLLVGSGLMLRSYLALRAIDPGYETEGLLTARLSVPAGEIAGWQETMGFFRELRERLEAKPGVDAVGLTGRVPLTGGVSFATIDVEDHPRGPTDLPIFATQPNAGVGYFESMGIDVLEGRTFRTTDGAEADRSVVVSASFANAWWPGGGALGRRVGGNGDPTTMYEIVGIVGDVHQVSLEEEAEQIVYFPLTFGPADRPLAVRTLDIVLRTSGDPLVFVSVLREELRTLNPRIPLASPRTMTTVFDEATSRTSFTMSLLGVAAGIALVLGLIGIYGVISYVVSQRTREIGVRMALGASAPRVRSMVVRQGLTLAAIGAAVGLVAATLLSTAMSSLLYGVSAKDPLTYAGVAVSLVAVSVLACWLPARRAAGVDPSLALRAE